MQNAQFAKENIAYWTDRAAGYSQVNKDELASNQRAVWKAVVSGQIQGHFSKRLPCDIHILDIGTGPGFFAIILAEMGYHVTAVDYTDSMLQEARRNAGPLALKIDFRQMDAEHLSLPEEQFDVVLSRNVTWNLHDPETAYHHWARVLKRGGLLLNFDANWYRYLFDSTALNRHLTDRENVTIAGVADDTEGTDVDKMETIARKTYLASQMRPEWNLNVLNRLGMEPQADRDIWQKVWTEEERINNASTPMFMISAVKATVLC